MLTLAAALWTAGCAPPYGSTDESYSFGTTSNGMLVRGVSLPERGPGYVRARPGEATRAGTTQLVGALSRAAAAVEAAHPGGSPLRIGDLSSPHGGQHPRHGSHRAGRDADVIFYATDHGPADTASYIIPRCVSILKHHQDFTTDILGGFAHPDTLNHRLALEHNLFCHRSGKEHA